MRLHHLEWFWTALQWLTWADKRRMNQKSKSMKTIISCMVLCLAMSLSGQEFPFNRNDWKINAEGSVIENFQGKNSLYLLTTFGIIRPWNNIPELKEFDLGFWQTSKQIYKKLQCKENVFGKFQNLPCLFRKMVLNSSTRFGIMKPWTNIPWLRRFDLGF